MLVHPRDSIHNPPELVEFTLVAQKLNRLVGVYRV